MKKYIALLSVCLLLSLATFAQSKWDGETKTPFSTDAEAGESAANPILITSAAELAYLASQVDVANGTASANTYAGVYFKLTTDIDLDNKEWYPIGWHVTNSNNRHFKGHFDGDGHTVKNLCIAVTKKVSGANISHYGFFGATRSGSIKNLGVEGTITAETSGWTAAGISAFADGVLIENCYSKVDISVHNHAAGIAAVVNQSAGEQVARIRNCYNAGSLNTLSAAKYIGGIVAISNKSNIENCYNLGNITYTGTPAAVGGIAGTSLAETNTYYLSTCVWDGNAKGMPKSETELKEDSFLTLLNNDQRPEPWIADGNEINNGFPKLSWEYNVVTGLGSVTEKPSYFVTYENGKAVINGAEGQFILVADMQGRILFKGIASGKRMEVAAIGRILVK